MYVPSSKRIIGMDKTTSSSESQEQQLQGTPEQLFMIMMQERVDKLEDALNAMRNVEQPQVSRYHHVRVSIHDAKFGPQDLCSVLDKLFQQRASFRPRFAAWSLTVFDDDKEEESYAELSLIVSCFVAVSSKSLEDFMCDPDAYYNLLVKSIDSFEFHTMLHDRENGPYHPDNGDVEYWHFYPGIDLEIEYGIKIWPDERDDVQFTSSGSYSPSPDVQKYLQKRLISGDVSLYMDMTRL